MKRLETAGFVTRTRPARDERHVLVEPTAQGAELRPRTSALNEALLRNSGLDIPGLASLTRQMQDLTDHLRGDEDS
ncbi:hypothetical protein [Tessaracoccus flavescens]|uniref:hypothetical protein n=1 Tax=Tessaracoccus flavescens TaxID=399497 RepID=UPI00137476FB|nr:hypothetical protein [Tessaracoccus flavescens]